MMRYIMFAFCFAASLLRSETLLVSELVDVYDIDTFNINIAGVPSYFGQDIPIRVNGIDGPEIRGKCESEKVLALMGRWYAQGVLSRAKKIELRNIERGKYFRLVADVYVDDQAFSTMAIERGLARPYDGGSRLPWCD